MFSMTGLTPEQIRQLREEHHVYLLPSGRISVTGCKSDLSVELPDVTDIG
jgi:aspartate aminotransferase